MILMLDNYDSFTYNLVQLLGELGREVKVVRNDDLTVEEAVQLNPEAIVISPGPGRPENAGISVDLVRMAAPRIPLLGVCLGHQALGSAFGAAIVRAETLMHGKTSDIRHQGAGLYEGVPSPFPATRYHSLILEKASLPPSLEITAWTGQGTIMGVRHRQYPAEGVQFHPESILTGHGKKLLANFLESIS
ncbi:MAG: anthranilate synthase component II [Acidobacteriota bacterium]